MAWSFTIQITGDIDFWLNKAREKASSSGVALQGDARSGSFCGGGVTGNYHCQGSEIQITITRQPFLLPRGLIESHLREFFS